MGNGSKILSEAETIRVRAVVGRFGLMRAQARLGVSLHVLEQARDYGRISVPAIARLMEAVEREERIANVA